MKNVLTDLNILAKWNQLGSRERWLCIGAGAVLALLLLDVAVARPLWSFYVSVEDQTRAQEQKLMQNMLNITRKDAIEKEYEEYQKFIHVPGTHEEETAAMLREIEKIARSNEVVVVDMKPKETKDQQYHREYTVELDVETEMAPLLRFIYELESSLQLLRVGEAKLSLKGKDQPVVKAKMTITKMLIL